MGVESGSSTASVSSMSSSGEGASIQSSSPSASAEASQANSLTSLSAESSQSIQLSQVTVALTQGMGIEVTNEHIVAMSAEQVLALPVYKPTSDMSQINEGFLATESARLAATRAELQHMIGGEETQMLTSVSDENETRFQPTFFDEARQEEIPIYPPESAEDRQPSTETVEDLREEQREEMTEDQTSEERENIVEGQDESNTDPEEGMFHPMDDQELQEDDNEEIEETEDKKDKKINMLHPDEEEVLPVEDTMVDDLRENAIEEAAEQHATQNNGVVDGDKLAGDLTEIFSDPRYESGILHQSGENIVLTGQDGTIPNVIAPFIGRRSVTLSQAVAIGEEAVRAHVAVTLGNGPAVSEDAVQEVLNGGNITRRRVSQ